MQETLNFLKLNNSFLAAIDINISNIPPEWSNWGNNARNKNDVESDVEQQQSNSKTLKLTFQ